MTHDKPPIPAYEYTEAGNMAHPLSGLRLEQQHVDVIDQAMGVIEQKRGEPSAGNTQQFFAGIVANEERQGGTLLVIDVKSTKPGGEYVVRTTPLAGPDAGKIHDDTITEDRRTHYRGPGQTLATAAFGEVDIDIGEPDARFGDSNSREFDIPFAAVYGNDGKRRRVVSLEDAMRQPTASELEQAKTQAARDAIDLDRHLARYPNLTKGSDIAGKRFPSGERRIVEQQLGPIREALESESLGPRDRERLVRAAHTVMAIAEQNFEGISRAKVLDPEEAHAMALAEDPAHNLPNGLFGRHRQRNQQQGDAAAQAAQRDYRASLRHPEA